MNHLDAHVSQSEDTFEVDERALTMYLVEEMIRSGVSMDEIRAANVEGFVEWQDADGTTSTPIHLTPAELTECERRASHSQFAMPDNPDIIKSM